MLNLHIVMLICLSLSKRSKLNIGIRILTYMSYFELGIGMELSNRKLSNPNSVGEEIFPIQDELWMPFLSFSEIPAWDPGM